MITAKQEIKNARKKTKAWLVSLTYHAVQGDINLHILSQRLSPLFKTIFKPEALLKTIRGTLPETIEAKEAADIKKSIMSRLTPNKFYRRMLSYLRISTSKTLAQDKTDSFTLGRLFIAWAILTDQSPHDFMARVSANVTRLYIRWHNSTSCLGLTDEECLSHPKESARFWSGICRTLIQATPAENLTNFMQTGIKVLGTVIEMPGLEKEIYKLLGQASHLMTKDAVQKMESALKANPHARERISIPELKALVMREEARLCWNRNNTKAAIKTLHGSLTPELKEAVEDNEEAIRSSMEEVSRRGLFNNLLDALNGQLRPRFIKSIMRFLKSIVSVESNWEFDASSSTQENAGGIRRWLFRR